MTKNQVQIQKQTAKQVYLALKTSPERYLQSLQPKKITDVFDSGIPALATITKECGENVTRAALVFPFAELLDFFNVDTTMSDVQIATTINLLIEEYPYLQLDDVKLCFRNVMKGKYGKVYNRIDGQMILEWFKAYDADRTLAADEVSFNDHKSLESQEKGQNGVFYEEYRKELEEKAAKGDEEAKERLAFSDNVSNFFKQKEYERSQRIIDEYEKNSQIHQEGVSRS